MKKTEPISICQSIRSPSEPHVQCLFRAKPGKNYCGLHLSYANITDYSKAAWTNVTNTKPTIIKEEPNPIYSHVVLSESNPSLTPFKPPTSLSKRIPANQCPIKKYPIKKYPINKSSTPKEQQTKTIIDTHQTNENELEVKLLIMINDDESAEKIAKLIGPCFNNITLSEDEEDPVTMDKIWEWVDGVKVGTSINKYYLFSYVDSKNKIRCMTVFTLNDLLQSGDPTHPITTEPIPEPDIIRARELIDLYATKLNLFEAQSDIILSPIYRLKNKIGILFKKFHALSIFFEEEWLTSITSEDKLFRIITETKRLVNNNIRSINVRATHIDIFSNVPKRAILVRVKKPIKYDLEDDETNTDHTSLKEYIVDGWDKLIKSADNENNQIPIWIIAHGLSYVVPAVKMKYPDLELMIQ